MTSSDSIDLKFDNIITSSFFISLVISDPSSTDEDLEYLNDSLSDILYRNPSDVLITINKLKGLIGAETEPPKILDELEDYIKNCF